MYFSKHRHRNQTNRNIIIIAIGFLATVLAGTFVFQMYMGVTRNSSKVLISITIDSSVPNIYVNSTFTILDTCISHTVLNTTKNFTLQVPYKTHIPIQVFVCDSVLLHDTVFVRDSVSYVFLQIDQINGGIIFPKLSVSK